MENILLILNIVFSIILVILILFTLSSVTEVKTHLQHVSKLLDSRAKRIYEDLEGIKQGNVSKGAGGGVRGCTCTPCLLAWGAEG